MVLDGEVAATDANGNVDFESIMERFSLRKSDKIRQAAKDRPVNYIVFDILRLKGVDLRGLPLYKRKEILSDIDLGNPYIAKIPFLEEEGQRLYDEIKSRGMEGIVAKHNNSIYVSSRSEAWQKIINWTYVDVFITGYRKKEFGWLVAVEEKPGKLRPAGMVELGVTPKQRMAFYQVKDALMTSEDDKFVYLEPRIKGRIKTRNWTKAGLLRSPAFAEFLL
ncbi:ATP-dependent DNA ligase [Paenibacillus naphthalenovorans]|uniref:ATP-dependent DNA ligase n=1 Tax=Paenibacillus naphthalenovorans TaxID=162209 RepID=UPI003D2BF7EB